MKSLNDCITDLSSWLPNISALVSITLANISERNISSTVSLERLEFMPWVTYCIKSKNPSVAFLSANTALNSLVFFKDCIT